MVVRVDQWDLGYLYSTMSNVFGATPAAWSMTGLRVLERGRHDSVTILSNAKRTIRKDEDRTSYAG